MSTKGYRGVFASPAHSGFRKGNLGLCKIIIIGTSVCDKKDSLTISTPVMRWGNGKIAVDVKVAASSPLSNHQFFSKSNFPHCFSVLTKNLCQHSSVVPRPHIKAFVYRPWCCFTHIHPLIEHRM